jgi:hypothetical protein
LPGGGALLARIRAETLRAFANSMPVALPLLGREWRPAASHQALGLRWRRGTAGRHAPRLTHFACAHFFPDPGDSAPHRSGPAGLSPSPVEALPVPGNALQILLLGQPRPPQRQKETGPLPLLEMLADRARAGECLRQNFPLASSAQSLHNGRKDLARRPRLSPHFGLSTAVEGESALQL